MRRIIPTALALVLCVACGIQGVSGVRKFMRPPDATFVGPGEFVFKAPVAGEYTLWHRDSAVIDGIYRKRDAKMPNGATIEVRRGGHILPVKADGSVNVSSGESHKVSLLRFVASEPDEYTISISGLSEKYGFEITHGPVIMPLFAAISWFISAGMLALISVVFLVLAIMGIFPRKSPSASQPQPKTTGSLPTG